MLTSPTPTVAKSCSAARRLSRALGVLLYSSVPVIWFKSSILFTAWNCSPSSFGLGPMCHLSCHVLGFFSRLPWRTTAAGHDYSVFIPMAMRWSLSCCALSCNFSSLPSKITTVTEVTAASSPKTADAPIWLTPLIWAVRHGRGFQRSRPNFLHVALCDWISAILTTSGRVKFSLVFDLVFDYGGVQSDTM